MSSQAEEKWSMIEGEIIKLLQSQHICVLGTVAITGGALVHGMHYVSDGLTVYVSSLRGTRKLLNIGKDPRVAYAVWLLPGHDNRHEARSLQMQAIAQFVTDEAERAKAIELMGEKEPWSKGTLLMRTNRWVRLTPVEAMWQQGAEEIDSRQIVRFSPQGKITDVMLYPNYVKGIYTPAAEQDPDE